MKLLCIAHSRERIPQRWLLRWMKSLQAELRREKVRGHGSLPGKELVIVFAPAQEIRALNATFRNHDEVTDILSFAAVEKDSIGELVLCWSRIKSQSRGTGLSPRSELGYMLIHGMLHLLGFTHDREAPRKRMFTLQERLHARLVRRVGLR